MNNLGHVLLWLVVVALMVVHLVWGELPLSMLEVWKALSGKGSSQLAQTVVWDVRVPRMLVAIAAGGLLAWLGMLMQTWFHNPLAGPGVLGVTSGGSLGVAIAVLLGWGVPTWISASLGCFGALALVGMALRRFASPVTTLVFGLMLSYVVGAAVTFLQASAGSEALQTFVFWGMGTFGRAPLWQSLAMLGVAGVFGIWLRWRARWLDAWTLGTDLASTMGIPRRQFDMEMLVLSGLTVGWVTSVCGPVAFLGLATPHVYRFLMPARSHGVMMWGMLAAGILLALSGDLFVRATEAVSWVERVPLNAVLAMMGAPVVLAVMWKRNVDWS